MKYLICIVAFLLSSVVLATPKTHTSISGAEYIQDESLPLFGEAYRGPNGIIWGSPLLLNEKPVLLGYLEALEYCEKMEARLPNLPELRNLENDLSLPYYYFDGAFFPVPPNSPFTYKTYYKNYSPMTYDGSELMLPYISEHFWVKVLDDQYAGDYYNRNMDTLSGTKRNAAVRCVGGKIWDGKKNSGPLMISKEYVDRTGDFPESACRQMETKCDHLAGNFNCADNITYYDWRLPTFEELKEFTGIPNATNNLITTKNATSDTGLYAINLKDGSVGTVRWGERLKYPFTETLYIRCIR